LAKQEKEPQAPPQDGAETTEPGAGGNAATDSVLIAAIERQNAQIEELGRLTARLAEQLADARAQSERDSAFLSAVDSVRTASSAITATAAQRMAAPQVQGPAYTTAPEQDDRCGEGPCECIAQNCCCFEIVMTSVRALAMQPFEVEDSTANPWSKMELRMFAYLDGGIGAVIPSMFSTIDVDKLLQWPGVKVTIERRIGIVCLPKGRTRVVGINLDVIESDAGALERLTGGRDEEGSNRGTMLLDCCCTTPQTLSFDVQFTSGGQGGGAIEAEFTARRTC